MEQEKRRKLHSVLDMLIDTGKDIHLKVEEDGQREDTIYVDVVQSSRNLKLYSNRLDMCVLWLDYTEEEIREDLTEWLATI